MSSVQTCPVIADYASRSARFGALDRDRRIGLKVRATARLPVSPIDLDAYDFSLHKPDQLRTGLLRGPRRYGHRLWWGSSIIEYSVSRAWLIGSAW